MDLMLVCVRTTYKRYIEQASACQQCFAACSFREHVHDEEMKGAS